MCDHSSPSDDLTHYLYSINGRARVIPALSALAAAAAAAAATALAALAATALSTIASKKQTCFATHGEGRCSFQNLVTPTGFYMLNSWSAQLYRPVAPGSVCTRIRSVGGRGQFAALSARAELPEGFLLPPFADPASYIDQFCGKWISAKQIVLRK